MPPDRDLYQLAQRLRLKSAEPIPRVVNPQPTSYQAGQRHEFWAVDLNTYRVFRLVANLRLVTPHAYFYVEDGVAISQNALEWAAAEFEERIYPTVIGYFGPEWQPGVDNDPHLTILNAHIPGVGGYFSSSDEYPKVVNHYSNEREMLYVNILALPPGTPAYSRVLAHELAHAAQWRADAGQETWLEEGLAELGAKLAGYQPASPQAFLTAPDTSLTIWEDEPSLSGAHYGAAYLFVKYLMEHYGGYSRLPALLEEPADGTAGIDAFLKKLGYNASFDSVFGDWVIANYLDASDGPYSYPEDRVRVSVSATVAGSGQVRDTVHQYAADHIDLSLGGRPVEIDFNGNAMVNILPVPPHSGRYLWWGNRGDSINSTLSREFDLSRLERATLDFWTWYDVEKGWDYAYVEVSPDDGRTWSLLEGQHTTRDDPVGNSFGPGYTGSSDAWVRETIDLTPYVGGKVWLRFEYVTDEAVSRDGFAIDDVSIPELGFFDDAEAEAGWQSHGFVRTDNQLPQRFIVQLIELGAEPQVRPVALDSAQRGRGRVGGLERAVLVVAAITPVTGRPAQYTVSVSPAAVAGMAP